MFGQTTIQGLPDEILIHIFMHHKPFRSNDVEIATWLAIPAVCRKWRALCLASPLYWTHILMPNPMYLRLILERSREAPLVVFIDTEKDDAACIALLEGHVHHTRYLNIRTNTLSFRHIVAHTSIDSLLQKPMPQMRGLYLEYHSEGPPVPLGALYRDTTILPSLPALRLLDMRGLRLDWETPLDALSQLTRFHIEDLYFADMRGALTNMPNLRDVAAILHDPDPKDRLPPSKSLVWPQFKSLELLCTPYAARAFREVLSAPDPARLTWSIKQPSLHDDEDFEQYETLLRETVRSYLPHLPTRSKGSHQSRQLPALTLITSRNDMSFNWSEDPVMHTSSNSAQKASSEAYAVSIKFVLPFWPDAICTVPLDGVQSLCIEEGYPWRKYYNTSESYPSPILFPHLRDLRVLLLRSHRVDSPILRSLAAAVDELLLPRLEHIIVENTDLLTGSGHELLGYLKRRATKSQWLKELTIRRCTMSSGLVAELDTYVRLPVSWDYISTSVPL